jgi:two-component system chemotaxis response regulator CheY
MKILIVEDEIVSRTMLQRIMARFGECKAVDRAEAAIAVFKKALESRAPFDLITLDISMPGMDGTEALYKIREIEKEKSIPKEKQVKILMVTVHSDKDMIIACIQAECDGYIVKPFSEKTIIERIEKIKS